jgi:hypothetical protein
MAFNINDIRSQLTYGGAKASLFQVQIFNPATGVAEAERKTPFMVKATSLPASTLGMIEVPYFGRKVKIAGDRTFEEWSVTVINDEDFLIRNAMEQWSASVNAHQSNISSYAGPASLQYKSTAIVTQFSKAGEPVREYTFNGIYPTSVAAIEMAWETVDQIEEFQVTFAYDWWSVTGGLTRNSTTE